MKCVCGSEMSTSDHGFYCSNNNCQYFAVEYLAYEAERRWKSKKEWERLMKVKEEGLIKTQIG